MKTLFGSLLVATLFVTSTAFAFRLPENQPIKSEPEGPDVAFHKTVAQTPSGLDGLVIR